MTTSLQLDSFQNKLVDYKSMSRIKTEARKKGWKEAQMTKLKFQMNVK